MKLYKKGLVYFERHPLHSVLINVLLGIGLGVLLTYPVAGIHPLRWGETFLVIGVLGYLWAIK